MPGQHIGGHRVCIWSGVVRTTTPTTTTITTTATGYIFLQQLDPLLVVDMRALQPVAITIITVTIAITVDAVIYLMDTLMVVGLLVGEIKYGASVSTGVTSTVGGGVHLGLGATNLHVMGYLYTYREIGCC